MHYGVRPIQYIRAAAIGLALLAPLAGCGGAPAAPASVPATAIPQPSAVPATAILPTAAPAPPSASPTAAPPTAAPQPSAAPQPAPAPQAHGFVIYQQADGSLQRTDEPGAPPIALADPTEPAARLPWAASPDGATIALVTGKGLWYRFTPPVSLALWLVGADGSNPRKLQDLLPPRGVDLTPGGHDAFNLVPALTAHQQLAWSPDGQRVAFVSAHENQVDLYAAALDGTVTRLTNTPRLEQGPVWSPDGALVAYRTTSGFGSGAGWSEVAVEVSARGGGAPATVFGDRKLAAGTQAAGVPDLIWISPGVVVAGYWDPVVGNAEIRALDAGTSSAQAIWSAPYSALAWNAVTGQLAIAGTPAQLLASKIDQRALVPGLYTWSPGAGRPTQIDQQPAEHLAWAPQGDALAYSVGGSQPSVQVWSIGAEGDIKPIVKTAARQLSWSLDGQQLAVDRAVYSRAGAKLSDPPAADGAQVGWLPQGLVYDQQAGGDTYELVLWDGATAHRLAANVGQPGAAGVVNSVH